MVELLSDPARCQVMLVTLPEETPVNELVDTAFAIEDRVGVALGPVVVNGCVAAARRSTATLRRPTPCAPTPRARRVVLDDARSTRSPAAAAFRAELRTPSAASSATRLAERLPLPQIRLPFLFTADVGPAEIELLADELAARHRRVSTT